MTWQERARHSVRAWLRCGAERGELRRELAELRETHRHVSAAADRWRQALEEIAELVVPEGRDFELTSVPGCVKDRLRWRESEVQHLKNQAGEQAQHYVSAVRAKREAPIERNQLKAALKRIVHSANPEDRSRALAEADELLQVLK